MSGTAKRAVVTAVVAAAVVAAIVLYVTLYLTNVPGSVAATRTPLGAQLYLATVPEAEKTDPHNTWVSFYAVDATAGHWQHETTWELPANSLVRITIYQFDGPSGLRNPFIGQVAGTVGGVMSLDGKITRSLPPEEASHAWAVPQLGISVPLQGVAEEAKGACERAPCSLANAHHTISFVIHTPGKGLYRWQCFVPCAAGFIQGFGGPMQTVGYMGGFLKIV
ncbi:MAG TPA: hypothetical protein VMB91_00010 [Solirubrobacteraceae bacterium]|nr:hypothetical protein [Solirubrobacteraceae bacterium]